MRIVIEIPDEIYEDILKESETSIDEGNVVTAVRNGTPLPKGHGDLIDRDHLVVTPIDATDLPADRCLMVYCAEEVDDAPIILPAERGVSE